MGVFIAAGIATALIVTLWGGLLRRATPRDERRFLLVAGALTLPMFFVALWGVRLPFTDPLIVRFASLFHPGMPERLLRGTAAYLLPKSLEAPLVEEPAKLWPLLLPLFRARLDRSDRVRVALALGVGFAVSEVWGLAALLARVPAYRPLPFWMFGGFIGERVMVGFLHGAMTSLALRRWRRGFALGVLAAMGAHWAGNFPIILRALDLPPLGRHWPSVILAWLAALFVGLGVVVTRSLPGGAGAGARLFGYARCPKCHRVYPRPLLALNLGPFRFERCARCHAWSLISASDAVDVG